MSSRNGIVTHRCVVPNDSIVKLVREAKAERVEAVTPQQRDFFEILLGVRYDLRDPRAFQDDSARIRLPRALVLDLLRSYDEKLMFQKQGR